MRLKDFFNALPLILCLSVGGSLYSFKAYSQENIISTRSTDQAVRRAIRLTTGEEEVLDVDFQPNEVRGENVIVANPDIVVPQLVTIRGRPSQIVFKPRKAGTTNVTVRDNEGRIRIIFDVEVTASNLLKISGEIRDLLRDIEGIQIRVLGQNVVIDGEILVPDDYGRLLNVLSSEEYGSVALNLARMSPFSLQVISKRIEQDIKSFAPQVTTRVVNNTIWLEGTVESAPNAQRAQKVAEIYLPPLLPPEKLAEFEPNLKRFSQPIIQNFIIVQPKPEQREDRLVRVTVHFVELSKDYMKSFGFKWQPGFTSDPSLTFGTGADGGAGVSGGASFTATLSSLFPRLQSAQNAGFARILKTGTMITRNGEAVNLRDQTQVPYLTTNENGNVVTQTQAVGLAVAVTPSIIGDSEDIKLDLDMNQVNLTGTLGDSPVTSEHAIKTKIFLRSRESAAVSAVNSSDVKTNFNKEDPNPGGYSGVTSPLFNLLRSKSYTKQQSQIVIFVTPEIIANASEGTQDLKKNFRVRVN
jgi:pilus assembly protein CpaC